MPDGFASVLDEYFPYSRIAKQRVHVQLGFQVVGLSPLLDIACVVVAIEFWYLYYPVMISVISAEAKFCLEKSIFSILR